MIFYEEKNKLIIRKKNEILCVEGWGKIHSGLGQPAI